MKNRGKPSKSDIEYLKIIRANVERFLRHCSKKYGDIGRMLDIAPQDYEGARAYFLKSEIHTLDIDPNSRPTYTADICKNNAKVIPSNYFDFVVCTEVLEHTLDPLAASKEIKRILKPGGFVFISTPFNFRIHGPAPDCWRFTEQGLRVVLKDFKIIELKSIKTNARPLMPIHYTVVAQKKS